MREQRYFACSFLVETSRWSIWDAELAEWVDSKLGHRFIFATRKAAVNKAEKLNQFQREVNK